MIHVYKIYKTNGILQTIKFKSVHKVAKIMIQINNWKDKTVGRKTLPKTITQI